MRTRKGRRAQEVRDVESGSDGEIVVEPSRPARNKAASQRPTKRAVVESSPTLPTQPGPSKRTRVKTKVSLPRIGRNKLTLFQTTGQVERRRVSVFAFHEWIRVDSLSDPFLMPLFSQLVSSRPLAKPLLPRCVQLLR